MKKLFIITVVFFSTAINAQSISENEKAGILQMREEEKMARDVYQTLNEKWDQMPFVHISESEINHMAQMKMLIDKYQLKDPVEKNGDKRGAFDNQVLKTLYEELTLSGKVGLESAFRAGAKVEEVDIRDLKEAMTKTSNEEIKQTYAYLIRVSENHLRAFARNLKRMNVIYSPIVLSTEEFDKIINAGNVVGPGKGCCQNSGPGRW